MYHISNTFQVKQDRYLDLLNKTKIFERGVANIFSAEEGIQKVHQGGFAFHAEATSAYQLIGDTFEQESICDLAKIRLINSDASLMAQKKSQYKKLFQVRYMIAYDYFYLFFFYTTCFSLRKMWQSGIIKKLYQTWVTKNPECLSSARVISVSINDLFLPYFLLALGIVASLLILIAETSSSKMRQEFSNSRNPHIPYSN